MRFRRQGAKKYLKTRFSGAKAKRPGLQAVLQFAGLRDTLMIWQLDRLSRSLKDLVDMVKLLELNSIGLKSLKVSVDTFPVPGC